ncbi:MAG: lipopolysaccharide transport periplasmic protein LptA [Trichloromonadaceae bacterium]
MLRQLGLLLLFWMLLTAPVGAAAVLDGQASTDQPIDIRSDRLEANDAKKQMRFLGNVVARQGDLTIYAQEITIFYAEGAGDIDRVEALRDVRIVQGEKVATGQKGVFFNREAKIVLTGSPRINQGQDFISGEQITVFLNEERSVVSGQDGGRVNAVFHPKGQKQ